MKGPRCLWRGTVYGHTVRVLPLRASACLLISLISLLGGIGVLEYWLIPYLEAQGRLGSWDWQRHNIKVTVNNRFKNAASRACPVWRSVGHPVAEARERARRILVMGDSFVWGDGYANMNDLWWRQLQRELSRRGYGDVEVIAAGLRGDSTRTQLEAARVLLPRYRPDLIIWGYVPNDPDEKVVRIYRAPREPAFQFLDRAGKAVVPHVNALIQSMRDHKRAQLYGNQDEGYPDFEWELKLLEGHNFELYKRTIAALARLHARSGVPGFAMALPHFPFKDHFAYRFSKVRELFESRGIRFYDILDELVAQYPGVHSYGGQLLSWGVNPVNSHPGPRLTHFYGMKAADILEADYAPLLGSRTMHRDRVLPHINDWLPVNLYLQATGVAQWRFVYPVREVLMPAMPIGQPYVQFNLAMPVALKAIELSGPGLQKAHTFVSLIVPDEGYDDGHCLGLGDKVGSAVQWRLEGKAGTRLVNTVRVVARFKGLDQRLTLTLLAVHQEASR